MNFECIQRRVQCSAQFEVTRISQSRSTRHRGLAHMSLPAWSPPVTWQLASPSAAAPMVSRAGRTGHNPPWPCCTATTVQTHHSWHRVKAYSLQWKGIKQLWMSSNSCCFLCFSAVFSTIATYISCILLPCSFSQQFSSKPPGLRRGQEIICEAVGWVKTQHDAARRLSKKNWANHHFEALHWKP